MAAPKNVELLLQVVLSVDQLSIFGAVADMTEELPVGRKALEKPVASGLLDKQEILTQPALAEMQANEERQWNLLQEYEQRFEKLSEDQKISRLCSEAGLRLVEVGQFFYALPSPRGKANHSLCREYTLPRDQKRTRIKGWIQSNVRFGQVSDPKVCNKYGRYTVLKFKFNLWLKIKPNLGLELWTVLTNLPVKPCRSKRKRKLLGKPAAKARPILKPSSTSGWDFTPMEQRQWIVIEIQESNDPYCFHVSKFITRLLRHRQKINRQDDGAVHCDQVIDECKKKISDDTRYWSVEMTKQFANAQYWSIDKWISVLAKGGGQKKKVSILREPELSTENSCTFVQVKDIQEVQSILHCKTMMYCYQKVSPRKFTTSETDKKWGQQWITVWLQEESVSKQADKLCSSLLCIRWMIKVA